MSAAIFGGVAGLQIVAGYYGGKSAKIGYQIQAMQQRAAAQRSISAAKQNNMVMTQNYNDMAAANAVMGAMSGRSSSSGSLLAMSRADQEKLDWDIEWSDLSGQIGYGQSMAQAGSLESAGVAAAYGGMQQGLLSAAQTGAQYSMIGGKK